MPKITYILKDGTQHVVEVEEGDSLMEGAVENEIPGIVALCGGSCSCSTCHAYVDPAGTYPLEPADDLEKDVLEQAIDVRDNSRLTCQIIVRPEHDGMVVEVPERQND